MTENAALTRRQPEDLIRVSSANAGDVDGVSPYTNQMLSPAFRSRQRSARKFAPHTVNPTRRLAG